MTQDLAIQTLVHKCRYCGQVVLLKRYTASENIIEVQGARQYSLGWGSYTKGSQKLLICLGKREKLSGMVGCGREMKVTSFKEITL